MPRQGTLAKGYSDFASLPSNNRPGSVFVPNMDSGEIKTPTSRPRRAPWLFPAFVFVLILGGIAVILLGRNHNEPSIALLSLGEFKDATRPAFFDRLRFGLARWIGPV